MLTYPILLSVVGLILGVFIYWRESRSNAVYRTYNKIINKKELQMAADDKKGFFFRRKIQYRLLNAIVLTALIAVVIYYIPFIPQMFAIDAISGFFVAFLGGTYLAAALPAVKNVIDHPMDTIKEVGESGKEMVSDLTEKLEDVSGETKSEPKEEPKTEQEGKIEEKPKEESARERMKRKGYLK